MTVIVTGAVALVPAGAATRETPQPRVDLFQQVLDCAGVQPNAERLACYDRSVPILATAHRDQQIVVADREQLRETRRSLFGLRLPPLRVLGDGEAQIQTTIAAIGRLPYGGLTLTLADGARWVQTDDRAIVGSIAPGTAIVIRRGAMGSYFASIPARPGFKVERRN